MDGDNTFSNQLLDENFNSEKNKKKNNASSSEVHERLHDEVVTKKRHFQLSVEPGIIGSMFVVMLYSVLSIQYLRQRIAMDYNLDKNHTSSTCNRSFENKSSPLYILEEKVSAETAKLSLRLLISGFLPALISSIIFGSWGDRVGRKLPLLVSLFGFMVLIGIYLTVIIFDLPLEYLFIGHVACGFLGDFGNVLACSFSHLADICNSENRTLRMAVLETAIGIGGFVSTITSGFWDLSKGFQNPFWCMLAVAMFDFIYTLLFLPSLTEMSGKVKIKQLFSKEPFIHMFEVLRPRQDHRHIIIILHAICFCLLICTMTGIKALLVLYETGPPFCWNSLLVGIMSGLGQVGFFVALILLKIFPSISAEPKLLVVGVVTTAVSSVVFVFSTTTWMLFLGQTLQFLFNVPSPIIRSQSSRVVSRNEVGIVFSILSSAQNIGQTAGSLMFEGIFAATVSSVLPGSAFFAATVSLLLILPLYWIAYKKTKGILTYETIEVH